MRWPLVSILGLLLAGCQTSAENAPAPTSMASDAELFGKAKQAVLASLKDPDSAKFMGEFRRVTKADGIGGSEVVCGKVNSKNSLGGYTGPKVVAYTPQNGEVYLQGESSGIMGAAAISSCW